MPYQFYVIGQLWKLIDENDSFQRGRIEFSNSDNKKIFKINDIQRVKLLYSDAQVLFKLMFGWILFTFAGF